MIVERRLEPFEIEPKNVVPDTKQNVTAAHDVFDFLSMMLKSGKLHPYDYQTTMLETFEQYDFTPGNIMDGAGGGDGAGSVTGEFFDYSADDLRDGYWEDFDNYMVPYASDTGVVQE